MKRNQTQDPIAKKKKKAKNPLQQWGILRVGEFINAFWWNYCFRGEGFVGVSTFILMRIGIIQPNKGLLFKKVMGN